MLRRHELLHHIFDRLDVQMLRDGRNSRGWMHTAYTPIKGLDEEEGTPLRVPHGDDLVFSLGPENINSTLLVECEQSVLCNFDQRYYTGDAVTREIADRRRVVIAGLAGCGVVVNVLILVQRSVLLPLV